MKNIVNHGSRIGSNWCYWKTPVALMARYAPDTLVSDFLISRSGYFPQCWHNSAWRPNPLNEAIISLCVSGRGWIMDIHRPEQPPIALIPGDVIIVPPGVPHSYGADGNEPWTQLWFHAIGKRSEKYLAELGVRDGPSKGHLVKFAKVEEALHQINELRRSGCGRKVLLETAALGELALARINAEACLEPIACSSPNGETSEAAESARKLKTITSYFHNNFCREIWLSDIAKEFHVSESWLSHEFSEHSGYSPLGFVIHLRLQEACRILATSDRKLEDIAASIGYGDSFYFSRLFKKHVGMPPSAYRQQYSR